MRTLPPRVGTLPARVVTMQPGGWRPRDATSAQRGYGYRWRQARAAYLAEHPLCVMCQAEGLVTPATVVDHVVPHRGDQRLFWDRANWQPLCATHHSRDKQRAEQGL